MFQSNYINKAVMEVEPDEAGSNPSIGYQCLRNDITDNAAHIWTCPVIKCWSKLAMSQCSSKQNYKEKSCNYSLRKMHFSPISPMKMFLSMLKLAWEPNDVIVYIVIKRYEAKTRLFEFFIK
jgi:uracil DNA glycosylase